MSRSRFPLARPVLLGAGLAILAACDSEGDECGGAPCPPPASARLYVVNAARGVDAFQLLVDDRVVQARVESGAASAALAVTPGDHEVRAVPIGTTAVAGGMGFVTVGVTPRVVVVVDRPASAGAPALQAVVAADTGAIVPAGATKLRVIHGATGAPAVEVWRVQPDFATPTHVMTPFPEQAVSAYVQSTPGTWRVWVTRSGATDTLALTTVTLVAGQRASVVLLNPPQPGGEYLLQSLVEQ